MAKPDRKAPKGKPITSHQLFPAVVALWFAALFGLGSLAVRPSLLEDLVIRSRIDLIIPAAAPPLGVTARMLLALVMAAIGAIVGAFFARRLARSSQEPAQRKRGARTEEQGASTPAPDATPSMLFDRDDAADPQPGVVASRRRALALDDEDDLYVPHDMAPLPGGAPQIFAVADMNLGEPMRPADAPLDLAGMTLAPAAETSDWAAEQWEPSQPGMAVLAIDEAGDAVPPRQVFGMAPSEQFDAAPRQVFGQTVSGDHLPGEFIRDHGYQSSVFDTAEAAPLFPPRGNAPQPELADEAPLEPTPQVDVPPAAAPAPDSGEPAMIDLAHRLGDALRRRAVRNAAARAATSAADCPPADDCLIPPPYVPPLGEFDPSEAPIERPFAAHGPAPEPAAAAPQAAIFPTELPAALRPISLEPAENDEDAALLDSLLPPRHIPMPAPAASAFRPAEGEMAANEAAADEDYGSLLDIGQAALARSPFVRIAEDEDTAGTVEPVVIFPGQGAPAALPPFAAGRETSGPVDTGMDDTATFRRFDAPTHAGQGQPVAAPGGTPGLDPAETERALRSALVNLQRISGAA